MRTWIVDQFEFDDWQSEESIEVIWAKKTEHPFPDVRSFVSRAVSEQASGSLPEAVSFDERRGNGFVREHLQKFAGIVLPSPCQWPAHILEDDWNHFQIVLCGPDSFISYAWSTGA